MITKKFGELFIYQPKSTYSSSSGLDNGNYPFFTSSNEIKKQTNTPIYFKESIIIGDGGSANINYCNSPFSTNSHCYVYTSQEVNVRYIYFFLKHNIHLIQKGFKGSGIKNISRKYIESIDLRIPSVEDQNRIVTLLEKVEVLIEKRQDSLKQQELLKKSIFHYQFKDFYNSKTEPLNNYANIVAGITKGKDYINKETVEVPYLRVANVQDGYLDFSEIKMIQASELEVEKYALVYNDLLLTEGGDPDKLGRGFLWRNEIEGCIFQNHLFRVRVKERNKLNPVFLNYLVSSLYGKSYFLKCARQTTGIATINSSHVKNFPIFIPSIELQDSFAKKALKIEGIIKNTKQKISLLIELLKSLSDLAFRGELEFTATADLEVLLSEDYSYFKKNSDESTVNLLLTRLGKDERNSQKFVDLDTYNKGKTILFKLLSEDLVKQKFDDNKKEVSIITR